jgi:spore germination protein KC
MMKYKGFLAALLALLVLMMVTIGCWNRKELDELGIQLGTAIDKVGEHYRVAVQVVIPGEVSSRNTSSGNSPVTIFQAEAPTIFEALRKLTETSPRKVYSAHIRVLILSEAVAREGIGKVIDVFSRNPEARTDFFLMVARNSDAMEVLNVITPLEKIPADDLFYTLDTSSRTWSPTTRVSIEELIEQLVSEGISTVLTGVRVLGNRDVGGQNINTQRIIPDAYTEFIGLGVFRKDRLIGWLNEDESRGFNYIRNNVKSSAGHLKCPEGGFIVLETLRNNTKLKVDVINEEPVATIKVKNVSSVSDVACKIDLTNPDTIVELEQLAEEKLTAMMDNVVKRVQRKYKTDIFGFGQALYKDHPKEWRKRMDNWTEYFTDIKVIYEVEYQIRRIGTTNDSFLNEIK